jgi:hypothetical protein
MNIIEKVYTKLGDYIDIDLWLAWLQVIVIVSLIIWLIL